MELLMKVSNCKHKLILSYCLKCRENTESINPGVLKTSNGNQNVQYVIKMCNMW